MAFVTVKAIRVRKLPRACAGGSAVSNSEKGDTCGQTSRRRFLKTLGGLSLWFGVAPLRKARSDSILPRGLEGASSKWNKDHLCKHCLGRGLQTCDFCAGQGFITFDYALELDKHECPNCQGAGSIRCPACIGLGLSDIGGVLRNGSKNGTLRMLRNGDYEILDCRAFPSCDIYGTSSSRGRT